MDEADVWLRSHRTRQKLVAWQLYIQNQWEDAIWRFVIALMLNKLIRLDLRMQPEPVITFGVNAVFGLLEELQLHAFALCCMHHNQDVLGPIHLKEKEKQKEKVMWLANWCYLHPCACGVFFFLRGKVSDMPRFSSGRSATLVDPAWTFQLPTCVCVFHHVCVCLCIPSAHNKRIGVCLHVCFLYWPAVRAGSRAPGVTRPSMSKLRPGGHMQSVKPFNPAYQTWGNYINSQWVTKKLTLITI